MMYQSILIADDEELIRQGIIARLEYLKLKPSVVYEAENGLQALEILTKQKVDIVITDIRMADMDGLALIEKAMPLYPKIYFIILSGFAEFTYAQQAIDLGVNAYLLKPISNDALKKALEDAILKLEEGKQLRQTVIEGTRSIREKKNYLFEKNINELLRDNGKVSLTNKTYELINKNFPIKNKWVMAGILSIDLESFEQKQFGFKDADLIQFSVKNVFMEIDTQCNKTIVNNLTQANQLFILFSADREEFLRKDVNLLFQQLFTILREKMGILLTAGISSAKNTLAEENIKEAKEAFLQRMIYGRSGLYFYEDIKALPPAHVPSSELNMLRQYIEKHEISHIEYFVNELFSDERIILYNISYMRIVWLRIIDMILKTEAVSFVKDAKNVEKMVLNYDILVSFHSLKEFREYLYSLILESIQTEGGLDITSKSKIKLAIKYIQDNYNQDIAINDMADKFSMSPNYFSAVFKRETGQTTVNFIKDLRLKKACEYLTHSDKSVVEISKEVGYEDSQYFFKVFKKATGLTPLQYRKMHM